MNLVDEKIEKLSEEQSYVNTTDVLTIITELTWFGQILCKIKSSDTRRQA